MEFSFPIAHSGDYSRMVTSDGKLIMFLRIRLDKDNDKDNCFRLRVRHSG